ncbi:PQQ-dependent sugar dehydrogenase [Polymorphum gilvum]|uniref:Putative soluble aldose sugar dehydrogenase Asd-like protein n=1 Tax=Polymorphum gilvum (strain LMG 25793 / CGMCC 1.9160 / SL003B-26A1) TaxID=991905 RepID=F2IZX0_POLGS|nr:PQQ-dependent sugar dehydrogenase [Polymorphum gilvum]ADZ70696.1 Putative soluble aldose sugar dehydrogenase Asd-like protein [Polymorphum gilvum SL003B-26A1]
MFRVRRFCRRPLAALAAAVLGLSVLPGAAQEVVRSQQAAFRVEVLTDRLENPWALAFLPDGRMLVTERPGRMRVVEADGTVGAPLAGVPEVYDRGQGGLLDVVLDPDFSSNRLIYFTYAAPVEGGATTRLARARLGETALEDLAVLFTAKTPGSTSRHFGSRLAFGPDGLLYVTVGDRGRDDTAQDLAWHSGKVLRLTRDGAPAPDNPFAGRPGALPEIFTYGNRNPQGLAVTPWGAIWAHEHGPRGGDEVNVISAGSNFGWPLVTHGRAYSGLPIGEGQEKPGTEQPIHVWVPSIAPSGMTFYDGDLFPAWRGDLFLGALALTHLNRLEIEDGRIVGEERLLEAFGWRIRDVRSGPDGMLYLLTDEDDGKLVRLAPAD